ncbi:MAG: hypothetical protein P8P74_10050 [Crocinitomicaceae bacterium]|nr:hypothetical protein [Crocinitomicaceae bacterium]
MEVLILKTNVSSKKKVRELGPVFDNHGAIMRWSVDTEDRHNVMRIVAGNGFKMEDAIELIQSEGFSGNELDC